MTKSQVFPIFQTCLPSFNCCFDASQSLLSRTSLSHGWPSVYIRLNRAKLDSHRNRLISLISRSSAAKPGGQACNNLTRFKWASTIFSREAFRRWCAWRPLIKPIFNGSHHRLPTRDWKESRWVKQNPIGMFAHFWLYQTAPESWTWQNKMTQKPIHWLPYALCMFSTNTTVTQWLSRYVAHIYYIRVADKTTYYPQWTFPKWVVPYRWWRFVLPCYVQKYGIGMWVVPYRLWMFSRKLEHSMSTLHYFSLPLLLLLAHISVYIYIPIYTYIYIYYTYLYTYIYIIHIYTYIYIYIIHIYTHIYI